MPVSKRQSNETQGADALRAKATRVPLPCKERAACVRFSVERLGHRQRHLIRVDENQ
jgi:hypothetical protein